MGRRCFAAVGAIVFASLPLVRFAPLASPTTPATNPEAPPLHRTGGFGEPTCHECHSEYPINLPGGAVAIDGLPGRYEPGRTYRIAIVLASEAMRRAGFEASVRYADGPQSGEQAGQVAAVDGRVAVTRDSLTAVTFVHHSAAGSEVAGNRVQVSWAFAWTAPARLSTSQGIVLHVAANSANGDDSPLGDLVYTAEAPSVYGASRR